MRSGTRRICPSSGGRRPNPAAYARLYAAARAAIHRVDPGVPVLIGGLAGGHHAFLTELLHQPELRGQVDGLAVHAYAATPAGMLAQVRTYRRRLASRGFGAVPLYVTEYGWSSRPIVSAPRGFAVPPGSYAPPSVRPGFIVQAARDVLSSGCNVRMAVFYAWVTPQHTPVTLYDWYGVAAPDGGATPASAGHRPAGRGRPAFGPPPPGRACLRGDRSAGLTQCGQLGPGARRRAADDHPRRPPG